jgi:hypothetical protein
MLLICYATSRKWRQLNLHELSRQARSISDWKKTNQKQSKNNASTTKNFESKKEVTVIITIHE